MKLLYQLMIIILVPLLCITGVCLFQFDWMLNQMEAGTNKRMLCHANDVKKHFEMAISQIQSITSLLAQDNEIKKALLQKNLVYLRQKSNDFKLFGISGFLFLDSSLQKLCQIDHLPVMPLNSKPHPIFQKAMEKPQCKIVDIQDVLFVLAVYPIKTGQRIEGYVVAGMPIFPHLIQNIISHLKILLKVEYKKIHNESYLNNISLDAWNQKHFPLKIDDITLSVTIYENNIMHQKIIQSRTDHLIFSMAILAVFILGIALFVLRLISPINSLMKAMELYAKGNLKLSLLPDVKNEIGNLSQAFHRMIINLEHAEQRFSRIFEHAIEGIFQTHTDGYFIRANPALAKILGYTSGEELIEKITDIEKQLYVKPDDRKRYIEDLSKQRHVNSFEVELYRQDRSIIWVSINARIVSNINGDILYYEGFLVDITGRKKREFLEREQKALEIANRAKSEFLANVSHEIRTPLNAVLGLGKLLKKTEMTENQSDYLTDMLNSSQTLLELINDILDYSKVEMGKIKLMKTPFFLIDIYQNIISIFKQQIISKKMAIVIQMAPECGIELIADPLRIKQILVNLVGNAVKFTNKGQIWIQTESLHQTSDEIFVSISVTDTGIGIQDTDQHRIFEPFTQADASSTRKYCGTGLGLAICEKLIYKMNGKMFVSSTPSKGSTFSITLPLSFVGHKGSDQVVNLPVTKSRILVIEDDEVNAKFVQSVLRHDVKDVQVLADGHEVLSLLDQHAFDMIFMDIQLPEIDGYDLTRAIRQEGHITLPIIALTACAMKGDREVCLAAGMNDYLPKPFEPEDLLNMYHRWKSSVQPARLKNYVKA